VTAGGGAGSSQPYLGPRGDECPGDGRSIYLASNGPLWQYTALIPPGAILGESREITTTSPDLCGLMDELDDLFGSPRCKQAE
jgi:hypothetical protein